MSTKVILFLVLQLSSCLSIPDASTVKVTNRSMSSRADFLSYCKNKGVPNGVLHCEDSENLSVLGCYCITVEETIQVAQLGKCFYNCGNDGKKSPDEILYTTIPNHSADLIEYVCGKDFNRTDTLCGKCKDNHYPLAYSFDMKCIKCPYSMPNWWKFLAVAFTPLTIFYLVVLFFQINVTSSNLHGLVLYSQGLAFSPLARLAIISTSTQKPSRKLVRYIGSVYGIWNLDFFRLNELNICLKIDTLQSLALDLPVGFFPLLLIVVTYALIRIYDSNFKPLVTIWRPFQRALRMLHKSWEVKTSLIDAFATFFLLSYMKFVSVSFDLLAPVKVYDIQDTGNLSYTWRLYYDPTIPYFGKKHFPYAAIALSVLIVFVLLPTLLLTIYPFKWFQKFLNLFHFRWYILHTFVDTYQGCYKDGTEPGTRDCRSFASLFFALRLVTALAGVLTLSSIFFPIASMFFVIIVILLIDVQPYKSLNTGYSTMNATFLLLLALFYVCVIGYQTAQIKQPALVSPFLAIASLTTFTTLVYISVTVVHWMWKQRKFRMSATTRICAWRHGYEFLET